MVTEAVATQPRKEVAEGLLADAPHAARREPHALGVGFDQATALQLLGHALQAVEIARRVVAQQLRQCLARAVVELLSAIHTAHCALQVLDRLQTVHHAHCLVERQLLSAEEGVVLA